jgi:hypothetical protein
MTDTTQIAETLETIAGHIAQIAAPLAKTIDTVAFGGDPPRVVTFSAIDEAVHRGHRPGPHRAEIIENIAYVDSVLSATMPRTTPTSAHSS